MLPCVPVSRNVGSMPTPVTVSTLPASPNTSSAGAVCDTVEMVCSGWTSDTPP